jgi:hypothetical protein
MVATSPETDAGSDGLLSGHYRALSTYCVLSRSLGTKVYPPSASDPLCCSSPRDGVLALESLGHDVVIRGGREPVASQSEMLGDETIRREESLRMTRRFEPLQAPLPLPGGLVGVLGALIEHAMLTMFHSRQEFPLGGAVTVQFVGDDHAGNGGEALEQLPEESLRGFLVPPGLHQNMRCLS